MGCGGVLWSVGAHEKKTQSNWLVRTFNANERESEEEQRRNRGREGSGIGTAGGGDFYFLFFHHPPTPTSHTHTHTTTTTTLWSSIVRGKNASLTSANPSEIVADFVFDADEGTFGRRVMGQEGGNTWALSQEPCTTFSFFLFQILSFGRRGPSGRRVGHFLCACVAGKPLPFPLDEGGSWEKEFVQRATWRPCERQGKRKGQRGAKRHNVSSLGVLTRVFMPTFASLSFLKRTTSISDI